MTKIRSIDFEPKHILGLTVDPIVKRLRGDANVLEWAKIRKRAGPTASMIAVYRNRPSKIVACGGVVVYWAGTAELWMTLDVEGGKLPALAIAIRSQANKWVEDLGLTRIQSTVASEWEAGIRFLEWIGMEKEAVLRKFGPDQIDQFLYARVK
jgi:hypothetical protein